VATSDSRRPGSLAIIVAAVWVALSVAVTGMVEADTPVDRSTVAVGSTVDPERRPDRTRDRPSDRSRRRSPRPPVSEPEPSAGDLAKAPTADAASGVTVPPPPPSSHRLANTLLAIPRMIAVLALTGPRYAAAELDDYLESRSPNAFGRDVESSWRFGATGDWETALGPSLGLRLGYKFAPRVTVDAYGGLFGARGQSGGLRVAVGRYTPAALEPVLTVDAGRELARVFSGIGEEPGAAGDPYARGPRAGFDERAVAVGAGVSLPAGPLVIGARVVADETKAGDDGDDPISMYYDAPMLVGFDEDQSARTGELSVVYDGLRGTEAWVPKSAPSTGFYVRAAVAYTSGEADRTGAFATTRGTLEARRLFDLFHGDRVLGLGVRVEAIGAEATEIPFDRLPSLGGREWMRPFARDELRDRTATAANLTYEWPLLDDSRGFLFLETGSVQPGLDALAVSRLHLGYGGGIRVLSGAATSLRLQLAGSDDGDLGFLVQLGAL
jgi:hypothetical protein